MRRNKQTRCQRGRRRYKAIFAALAAIIFCRVDAQTQSASPAQPLTPAQIGRAAGQFMGNVTRILIKNWIPPQNYIERCAASVGFKVQADGTATDISVSHLPNWVSDPAFDKAAIDTVKRSSPLPAPPYFLVKHWITHNFMAEDAAFHWRKAVRQSPTAENYIALAKAYEKRPPRRSNGLPGYEDPIECAVEAYKNALKIDPASTTAKEGLKTLTPKLEWQLWNERVERAIGNHLGALKKVTDYRQNLATEVSYTITSDGQIQDVSLSKNTASPEFDANVLKAVDSLKGDPVLKFPDGATETSVTRKTPFRIFSSYDDFARY